MLRTIFSVIDGNTNRKSFFRFFTQKQKYICTGVNFFRYSTQKNLRKWFFAAKDFLRYLRQLKARKQSILRSLVFGAKKQMAFFKDFWEKNTVFCCWGTAFWTKNKMFLADVSFLRYIETKKRYFQLFGSLLMEVILGFFDSKIFLFSFALFTAKETWKTIFSFSKNNISFWDVSFFSTFETTNLVNNFTSLRQKNRFLSRD